MFLQTLIIQHHFTLIHPKGSINKNLCYSHLLRQVVTKVKGWILPQTSGSHSQGPLLEVFLKSSIALLQN